MPTRTNWKFCNSVHTFSNSLKLENVKKRKAVMKYTKKETQKDCYFEDKTNWYIKNFAHFVFVLYKYAELKDDNKATTHLQLISREHLLILLSLNVVATGIIYVTHIQHGPS